MRFPVFARGANPSVDLPIIRKKKRYLEEEVASGRADWIDPADARKGILCREMLYFGERQVQVETVDSYSVSLSGELPGLRFVPPTREKNPLITRVITSNLLSAARGWDWQHEQIPA